MAKTEWIIRHKSKGRYIELGTANMLRVTNDPAKAWGYTTQEQAWQDLQGLRVQDPKKFADYTVDMRNYSVGG